MDASIFLHSLFTALVHFVQSQPGLPPFGI
jgi:hypothetical protein